MQIKANGIMLEVEEHGPKDGTPLILVRGLGTQLIHWPREFVRGFSDLGYRTIIFDNRDVGLSQRYPAEGVSGDAGDILAAAKAGKVPPPAYAFEEMAKDVIGLMDALGITKAHIFGISMGGGIAQVLAVNHSDRLLTDTIVMTVNVLRAPELLGRVLVWPETREEAQENWLKSDQDYGSHGYPMNEEEIRAQAALAWDRSHDADGVNRQLLATFSADDRREALKSVDLPCLVIHGAIDTLIPPDAGREIAGLIPNAKLEIIEGMGHSITPLLAPVIVGMVDEFITSTS